MASYKESEIKTWLEKCLRLKIVQIKILNFFDKSEGRVGDILFTSVTVKTNNGSIKEHELVVKCSQSDPALRQKVPLKAMFLNEIYFYDTLIPAFTKFQTERRIKNSFKSIPKYYGHCIHDDREVIVFENLMTSEYALWNRRMPMTRKHINLVLGEYAKFHAVALAMRDQNFEKYQNLTEPFNNLWKEFQKSGGAVVGSFAKAVDEVGDLLQDDLDSTVIAKWKNFGKHMELNMRKLIMNYDGVKVVCHGDCWNNNFMFQIEDNDPNRPIKVSILDWQITKLSTPVSDLSHFIFSCISEEDLSDLSTILNEYYSRLSGFLKELNSNPTIYPKDRFLQEWKNYSKLGVMMTPIAMKFCTLESEDVDGVEVGVFDFKLKNTERLKKRMRPIVKYVVENNLIDV